MVEGPGCKLKGIKIKAKLKGQLVTAVRGNAVDKFKTKKNDIQERISPFHQLIGCQLEDVHTLGKELFMYFGEICLRVHFLMAGQSFINNVTVDNDPGENAATVSLELQMCKDVLTFKKASVDIRSTSVCRQKFENLNNLDICSPVFSFTRAFSLVREQMDRQVCDVLLDQTILPGVGNIIKNEALFDSGIKPSSKVCELKDEHIHHLLRMTRDFTNIFYQCRRDGKPLHPYYKIYGKRKCGQCEGKVTICRLGDDSERVTYFCGHCQTNDLTNKTRTLPKKNSLLGWVKTETSNTCSDNSTWSCDYCTLINLGTSSTCSVCLNPRYVNQSDSSKTNGLTNGTVKDHQGNAHWKMGNNDKKRKSTDSPFTQTVSKVKKIDAGRDGRYEENIQLKQSNKTVNQSNLYSGNALKENSSKIINNYQSTGHRTNSYQSMRKSQTSDTPTTVTSKIPQCPTHNKTCSMKEVRKEGPNTGRWFFSCTNRTCKFFEWADVQFPICTGHGKPCTIRTVMKIGPNNGRRFFTCKLPKNKQCKFFEWAEGYDD